MTNDWIDKLNTGFPKLTDRDLVEYFINWVHRQKKGDEFLKWLKEALEVK